MMNERAVAIRVEGLVQGVGYRHFVAINAASLGVTGWVANRPDGAVEAALWATGNSLGELVGLMRKGPDGAQVDALDLRSADRGMIDQPPPDAHTF